MTRIQRWGKRWAQGVTIVIWINLALVLFNLSYVSLRPFYQQYIPTVVQIYDPIKGITPHPVTQNYLDTIEQVRSHISQLGIDNPSTQADLDDVRQRSITIIEENPFLDSSQVTVFARLKQYFQEFTGEESAQVAVETFWQADYLKHVGWNQVNTFLTTRIEPLLRQNYFRATLPTGQYVDRFWRIDAFFIAFFAIEMLIRTLIISHQQQGVNWGVALARRWYELPLILPFWQWLRLLPAAVRLHRTQLCNVEAIISQVTHEPAAYLSDRVSKYVIVRLINQTQNSVREGALLTHWSTPTSYIKVGDPKKLDQITDRLVKLIVLRVIPTVKPDLEELLRHSMHRAIAGSQLYDTLRQIPGVDALPEDALGGISDYLAQATCDILADSYTDQEGRVLLDQLSRDFRGALGSELQASSNSEDIKTLLSDLLEELKVNYIQRSEQQNPEETWQEVDTLEQIAQSQDLAR